MKKQNILITGGAGFIGINAADYFLQKGYGVVLFDNLSRKGSEENLKWLKKKRSGKFSFVNGDVTKDTKKLSALVARVDTVFHLAAQVAVTTSVLEPHHDFYTNTYGTLQVLEAIRKSPNRPMIIYSSTNKVYGNIEGARTVLTSSGYRYHDFPIGVSEAHILDFHSPYGCSKGAADQYVRDYARIYGLKTVVFRQSCIYGPNQFGMEDQGWVAWFTISAILGRPITIYGDGHQVRDVLYVEDLCRLYEAAIKYRDRISGKIYNVGGGPDNVLSVRATIAALQDILGKKITYSFADWRPGDQKVFISDISKIKKDIGWEPKISIANGLKELIGWAASREKLFKRLLS